APCLLSMMQAWRARRQAADPEQLKAAIARNNRRSMERLWIAFFAEYGDRCIDCGEADKDTLTVAHLNGDGAAQRLEMRGSKKSGGGVPMIRALQVRGWPKDRGIATQCANCQLRDMRLGRDRTKPSLNPLAAVA